MSRMRLECKNTVDLVGLIYVLCLRVLHHCCLVVQWLGHWTSNLHGGPKKWYL